MKNGKYVVSAYNGKDATLVHEDGTFEILAKVEFPASFRSTAYVGETIIVSTIQSIVPEAKSDDERERSAYANTSEQFKRMKDLQTKEAARRAMYGGIVSIERGK